MSLPVSSTPVTSSASTSVTSLESPSLSTAAPPAPGMGIVPPFSVPDLGTDLSFTTLPGTAAGEASQMATIQSDAARYTDAIAASLRHLSTVGYPPMAAYPPQATYPLALGFGPYGATPPYGQGSASPSFWSFFPTQQPGHFPNYALLPIVTIASAIMIRLTSDNYLLWRTQVGILRHSHLLMGYVDGTIACPEPHIAVPYAGGMHEAPNPVHQHWTKQDHVVLSAFVSSMTEGVLSMIMFVGTSRETWEILSGAFASTSIVRTTQVGSVPLKRTSHYPAAHIAAPAGPVAAFGAARARPRPLASPPSSAPKTTPPSTTPKSNNERGTVVCQLCGIPRHVASKCYKRFNRDFLGLGNDGSNTEKQLAMAMSASHGSHGAPPTVDPAWYADSGATHHITHELDKLTTHEPYHGTDQVHTANGTEICIARDKNPGPYNFEGKPKPEGDTQGSCHVAVHRQARPHPGAWPIKVVQEIFSELHGIKTQDLIISRGSLSQKETRRGAATWQYTGQARAWPMYGHPGLR
ncbi:hypothetical protein QYE76_002398 [Lolium multiflorum]|uniref:Uncharacterized protein n=1 Tax=Lolium multiflorum TaxID=4521 RepID=A0AAD8W084_LOLMU|nr:hypothetical protein QYE76_002398 [Lolium multiflorum]